jgi:hypothetical protein
MTGEVDPICGCPVERLQSNRRDRRRAARRGDIPATNVNRHRRGCARVAWRSDNANDQAQRRDET